MRRSSSGQKTSQQPSVAETGEIDVFGKKAAPQNPVGCGKLPSGHLDRRRGAGHLLAAGESELMRLRDNPAGHEASLKIPIHPVSQIVLGEAHDHARDRRARQSRSYAEIGPLFDRKHGPLNEREFSSI